MSSESEREGRRIPSEIEGAYSDNASEKDTINRFKIPPLKEERFCQTTQKVTIVLRTSKNTQ